MKKEERVYLGERLHSFGRVDPMSKGVQQEGTCPMLRF